MQSDGDLEAEFSVQITGDALIDAAALWRFRQLVLYSLRSDVQPSRSAKFLFLFGWKTAFSVLYLSRTPFPSRDASSLSNSPEADRHRSWKFGSIWAGICLRLGSFACQCTCQADSVFLSVFCCLVSRYIILGRKIRLRTSGFPPHRLFFSSISTLYWQFSTFFHITVSWYVSRIHVTVLLTTSFICSVSSLWFLCLSLSSPLWM